MQNIENRGKGNY